MSHEDTDYVIAAHSDHYVNSMGAVPPSLQLLAEEAPAFFDGYSRMRTWALRDDTEGVLPLKYRHMLCSLLDCAGGNLSGATNHARAAVRRGLTVDEYRDAAILLIITDGTPTWGEMGRKVLEVLRSEETA